MVSHHYPIRLFPGFSKELLIVHYFKGRKRALLSSYKVEVLQKVHIMHHLSNEHSIHLPKMLKTYLDHRSSRFLGMRLGFIEPH